MSHDTQMSETEADADLKTFWMFSNVQFMYTPSLVDTDAPNSFLGF